MDTYIEFCIRFWEATRELDLYSMDGSQLDRLIVDALSKTNGGKELIKTSMNELSVLIRAINHNNRKIQPPSPPSVLEEAAEISFDEAKSLTEDYRDFLAKGLTENKPRPIGPHWFCEYAKNRFIAGAKWQEEKEKEYSPWLAIPKLKEAALEFGEHAKDYEIGGQSFTEDMAVAFTRGAEWQKEQMIKEAVEAEISVKFPIVGRSLISVIDTLKDFKFGDKVRIIIVKED